MRSSTYFSRRGFIGAAALALSLSASSSALAEAAAWSPLLNAEDAVKRIPQGDALVLDIRTAKDYAAGHIPGAISAPYENWRGPKTNPGEPLSDEKLTALLRSLGVRKDQPTVIAYQGFTPTNFGAAARVYWTLKASGVAQIAILNGGVNAWKEAKGALSTEATTPTPSDITASLEGDWTADWDLVADLSDGAEEGALVDARPTAFYYGLVKHREAVAKGTLKGANRLEHDTWFMPGSEVMTADKAFVRTLLERTGAVKDGAPTAVFCNTGHWAATTWFALSEIGGVENVKLYPGSMVDWTMTGGEVSIGGR